MKKFNKGIVIASTLAATLAAVTFAGCADAQDIEKKETAPAAAAVNKTVAAQVADNKTEAAKTENKTEAAAETKTEKKSEKKTETKKKSDNKKKDTKKKDTKKTEKKENKTAAAQNTQQAAPAAQPAKAAETKKEQAPAPVVVIPEKIVPADVYPVWVEGDVYAGTYVEEIAGRGVMDITRNSDGTYSVEVNWASNASEKNGWSFTGEFDGRGVLRYTNCRMTTMAYDENGNYTCDSKGLMTPYTTYTMGSGWIKFEDEGVLTWHDDMGDIIEGTTFVATRKTKAAETGTAGSNYYANEAEQGGWAGCRYYENEEQEMGGYAGCNYFKNEGFFTGSFYDVNGSKAWLEIKKSDFGEDLYICTVTCKDTLAADYAYGFLARLDGDMLVYDDAAKSYVVYGEDGSVVSNTILETGHFGHIRYSDIGLEWFDSNGTEMSGSYYVFTNGNM